MSQPGIKPGPPQWKVRTLEKSHMSSLFNCYLEPLHGCPVHVAITHGLIPGGQARMWANR
jgi:hypothetical protein